MSGCRRERTAKDVRAAPPRSRMRAWRPLHQGWEALRLERAWKIQSCETCYASKARVDFYTLVMGFRFRRSVKILPGVRLNFGKRGVSTSVGVRGAHVTFGKSGTRTTVGVPGTGLSYTHLEKPHRSGGGESAAPRVPVGRAWRGW